MRIAVVADIHIGNHTAFAGETRGRMNARCRQTLALLTKGIEAALAEGCSVFVVAGDVFDCDNPYPDQVAALLDVCNAYRDRIRMVFMVGNHDQHSTEPGDHALAPLRLFVDVVETPCVLPGTPSVLLVPYGYDAEYLEQRAQVVIAHHGIADSSTHPAKAAGKGVKNAIDLMGWMAERRVKLYLAGDWHEHRSWSDVVVQIGALAPVNWTNRAYIPGARDPYGSVIIVGDVPGGWKRVTIPGPRFMVAHSVGEARQLCELARAEGMTPYVDLTTIQETELPEDLVGSVRPPSVVKQREDAVIARADQIRSGVTQEEALTAWVAAASNIPEDLKAEVAERAKQFLRKTKSC